MNHKEKIKKYMAFDGLTMVYFVQNLYEDYTKHHDEKRRDRFRKGESKMAI